MIGGFFNSSICRIGSLWSRDKETACDRMIFSIFSHKHSYWLTVVT